MYRTRSIDVAPDAIHRLAMATPERRALTGLTLVSFESRRATEMAELIRRHGGTPVSAPSMREVPLEASPEAEEFLRRLERGAIDVVLLLTGVGTRALAAALAPRCSREHFAALLHATTVVARGPKPVAALRELGLTATVLVPEPNTWREILAALDAAVTLAGRCIAVQEYGRSNPDLLDALRARGADVLPVPVYRWDYPEDPGPLRAGVARLADGAVALARFTSARQVHHVVETATRLGRLDDLHAAAHRIVFASIGPVCSEALQAHDLPVDLEPDHPKMGQLINAVAQRGRGLLERKRG
jgi:uroporphyrinogen-III synthase